MAFTPTAVLIAGAGSATLATAVSNANTALAAGVTAAKAVQNVNLQSIAVSEVGLIWDGTLYIGFGTVNYNIAT